MKNGSRRNRKTGECEKYEKKMISFSKTKESQRKEDMEESSNRFHLAFSILSTVYDMNGNDIHSFSEKYIGLINVNIENNARVNSQNQILSDDFGIIELLSRKLTIHKIKKQTIRKELAFNEKEKKRKDEYEDNVRLQFIFEISTEKKIMKNKINTKTAEDIIYSILPASYSTEDKFLFTYCAKKNKCENLWLYFNDTPEDVYFYDTDDTDDIY
jgi:hypothetical protein